MIFIVPLSAALPGSPGNAVRASITADMTEISFFCIFIDNLLFFRRVFFCIPFISAPEVPQKTGFCLLACLLSSAAESRKKAAAFLNMRLLLYLLYPKKQTYRFAQEYRSLVTLRVPL